MVLFAEVFYFRYELLLLNVVDQKFIFLSFVWNFPFHQITTSSSGMILLYFIV